MVSEYPYLNTLMVLIFSRGHICTYLIKSISQKEVVRIPVPVCFEHAGEHPPLPPPPASVFGSWCKKENACMYPAGPYTALPHNKKNSCLSNLCYRLVDNVSPKALNWPSSVLPRWSLRRIARTGVVGKLRRMSIDNVGRYIQSLRGKTKIPLLPP